MFRKLAVGTQHDGLPTGDFADVLGPGADDTTNPGTGLGTSERLEAALVAARELLISTVEAINPGTSARELLACLARYRAHLAAVVAACDPDGGDSG